MSKDPFRNLTIPNGNVMINVNNVAVVKTSGDKSVVIMNVTDKNGVNIQYETIESWGILTADLKGIASSQD
mgnify:CR=1 FL=1